MCCRPGRRPLQFITHLDWNAVRQALYEVSGVSGIGKTHLLLRSAVEAMALGTSVLWIDATASFSIARMVEMVRSHGNSMSLGDMLTRIHIVRCPNLNRYLSVLAAARANILAAQHQQQLQQRSGIYWTHLGLVIVDSIHALVAPALAPSTTGSDLGPLVSSTLANATKEFGVDLDLAIVVTNLATTWRDVAKPALGYAWRFLVDERLVMDEWPSNLDAMTWPPPASRPRRISSDKAQRDIPMPIKLIVQ
ncbi:P-loop containing nucleoside triphosphate hydrolase protein [Blastocladiella britannica]|nr:P-loop containing nucleoside triphosphate hydrolase protein [Blastocladiella britannica]